MNKRVEYIAVFLLIGFLMIPLSAVAAYAQVGDMGFFGGISEGRRLPRTTEEMINGEDWRGPGTVELNYKEPVFLSGKPSGEVFEGLITVKHAGDVPMYAPRSEAEANTNGKFSITNTIAPSADSESEIVINRNAVFEGTYRVENTQVIYNLDITKDSWSDVIETPSGTYTLDKNLSSYVASIIEDKKPGINYYRGEVSGRFIYNKDDGAVITADITGSFYGYDSVWSITETHRMSVSLMSVSDDPNDLTNNWGMQYEVRPSVTVNKILQYTATEPTAISFEGNYKEVLQKFAGLKYDLFVTPLFIWDEPKNGTVSIESVNTFEQLPEPDLSFLKGNAAEDDIRKLFAMKILDGDPRYYQPTQAITRGQFMTALAKAIKLPLEELPTNNRRNNRRQPVVYDLFNDVNSTRPEFPYILALSKAGIAYGRDNGMFYFDYPIERQEAFTVMVRALGLTQMGLNPTVVTPFADSDDIADYAIREVGVALQLGLIAPDLNGNIYPKKHLSKGEAAHLLNYFIEYMRNGLVVDYADQIVNIAK